MRGLATRKFLRYFSYVKMLIFRAAKQNKIRVSPQPDSIHEAEWMQIDLDARLLHCIMLTSAANSAMQRHEIKPHVSGNRTTDVQNVRTAWKHQICTLVRKSLFFYQRCQTSRRRQFPADPLIITYVDEVRAVLAGHTESEISPEARVFLHHLRRQEVSYKDHRGDTFKASILHDRLAWLKHIPPRLKKREGFLLC